MGDTVIVYHNQKKYFYQVYDTQVVTPDKIDILTQRGENRLTLITCTPVGTNLKRLVIFAKPTG
ncbi:Sortase family protein [compost metagenome]